MKYSFLTLLPLIAGSVLMTAGCSEDNSAFETPPAAGDTPSNSGTVSQKNLSLLADDPQPEIFDENGSATHTLLVMTAIIGDKDNQLLTDAHTIYFATEWGLIEPSCVTEDGSCTVTWQTSFGPGTVPADHLVTITAYTLGEESFTDSNGDGEFADPETVFSDREEPFIDADRDGVFNNNDKIIDVIDGNVLGSNGAHDNGDGFLNSPSCKHTSLCSITPTIYIWDDIEINMDGPPDTTPPP